MEKTIEMSQKPRLTVAKGRRPYFFEDPNTDKLLAMILALAGEVSVLRDRLDLHERLAKQGKPGTTENIEAYRLTEAEEDERAAARSKSLDRVLRAIKVDSAEDIAAAEADYSRRIAEISNE